jgi:hypothetical protein
MKPESYADGSYSREYKHWNQQSDIQEPKCALDLADDLDVAINLLMVCTESLCNSSLIEIKTYIANVLHFVIQEKLQVIKEELRKL